MAPSMKGPRAYWNWGVANASMILRTTRLRARPLKLTFDPTNVCQLACPLCPTGLGIQGRAPRRAPMHLLAHLMEEVGDYVFFLDFYNWGEPLLNKDLEKMIRVAARKRIVTSVSTNLSLPLSDERLHSLLTSGLSELIVSIDGASPDTYGIYRRRGDWALAMENLRRIADMKRHHGLSAPFVCWRFYVFRFNEHEIARAERMAAEMGVSIAFGTPFLHDARFPAPPSGPLPMAEWASTLPEFNRYQPGHPDYEDPSTPMKARKRCDWHYVSTAINPDGGVSPCCAVFGTQNDFGSLDGPTSSYMDVVNREPFRAIRDVFAGRRATPTGLVCERCPTPAIMNYGSIMNRHIALFSLAAIARTVRRILSVPRPRADFAATRQNLGSGAPER